ncbi:MAG: CPBP family glutamic-type intramembrane protease [Nanoarchaeota archaeon]
MTRTLKAWEKLILLFIYFLFVFGANYIIKYVFNLTPNLTFLGKAPFIIMMVFIIIFLAIKFAERKPFSHYGLKRFSGKDFRLMIIFILLLMPLAFLGRMIDPGYDLWYAKGTGLMTLYGVFIFAATMPLYVIKEEIIVRAFMQNRLRTYGFLWMAIALSINFAFAHFFLPEKGLIHVIVWALSVLVGSFALIVFFELTRNLWLSALLHLLFNVIIGLQIYLHVVRQTIEWVFWAVMMLLAIYAWKSTGKQFIQPFKEKIQMIPAIEIIFLIIFAILFPLALLLL